MDDMTLDAALHILARAHTRDDDQMGFVVETTARLLPLHDVALSEYIIAWGVVRRELHMPYKARA